jgi:hypothetical protein
MSFCRLGPKYLWTRARLTTRTKTTERLSSMSLTAGVYSFFSQSADLFISRVLKDMPLQYICARSFSTQPVLLVAALSCNFLGFAVSSVTCEALCSDSLGDSVVAGDLRWAGAFGVNVDFVARSHCSVVTIDVEEIRVNKRGPVT